MRTIATIQEIGSRRRQTSNAPLEQHPHWFTKRTPREEHTRDVRPRFRDLGSHDGDPCIVVTSDVVLSCPADPTSPSSAPTPKCSSPHSNHVITATDPVVHRAATTATTTAMETVHRKPLRPQSPLRSSSPPSRTSVHLLLPPHRILRRRRNHLCQTTRVGAGNSHHMLELAQYRQ